jgi:hypothetical protein
MDLVSCMLAVLGLGLVARVEAPDGVADTEVEVMPLRILLALPWVGVEDILGTFVRKLDILAFGETVGDGFVARWNWRQLLTCVATGR